MASIKKGILHKRLNVLTSNMQRILLCLFTSISFAGHAQDDAKKIAISTVQDLSFGAFFRTGNGGNVMVSYSGTRSASGGIILSNQSGSYYPAIFEITGPINSLVNILTGNDVLLYGSNGGSILLHLERTNIEKPYLLKKAVPTNNLQGTELISIGGTLSIGASEKSPAGKYNGSFAITIIQE